MTELLLILIGVAFLIGRKTAPEPKQKPLIFTLKKNDTEVFKWYVRRVPSDSGKSYPSEYRAYVEELYKNG